jgi:hypothetical protein
MDKLSADAFVDAYYDFNFNQPKPQGPAVLPASPNVGGNSFRAFDIAEGFAVNWAGVNVSYAADPIGGTIGLRMGPGAQIYSAGTPDAAIGLQFVKQAYATWKPANKVTLDLGKWDQPFGSEVADSQLNMNYTRTVLFWYAQPLWFTGLRFDYAASDNLDLKLFIANGWNNTWDNNRSKSFGGQIMFKPVDQAIFYLGYVGGPEQTDATFPGAATGVAVPVAPPGGGGISVPGNVPDANDHWRHLVDFVADINPTSSLRFLLNFDYRAENDVAGTGTHDESVVGGNLVAKYAFTDAFSGALRGEYYHDEHGDTLGTGAKTDFIDGTLTLMYGIGNHLAFMLDGRFDTATVDGIPNGVFLKNANEQATNQFTATLGVIASTK